MSGFSADWLQLREPFDRAARAEAAAELNLAAAVPGLHRGHDGVLNVLDLACGSGANLRALAPLLGGLQRWQVFDHDPALLHHLAPALASWARDEGHLLSRHGERLRVAGASFEVEVQRHRVDLAHDLAAVPFDGAGLVTASALLDLVSASWLARSVRHGRDAGAAMWFALSVDGRIDWDPQDPGDARMNTLFAQHQQRDKGFGPALGHHAAAEAASLLEEAGYHVRQARSDWRLHDPTMQAAMLDGMAGAAIEQDPGSATAVRGWLQRRRDLIRSARLQVGHVDLYASLQPAS